jgi:hypothetical protein
MDRIARAAHVRSRPAIFYSRSPRTTRVSESSSVIHHTRYIIYNTNVCVPDACGEPSGIAWVCNRRVSRAAQIADAAFRRRPEAMLSHRREMSVSQKQISYFVVQRVAALKWHNLAHCFESCYLNNYLITTPFLNANSRCNNIGPSKANFHCISTRTSEKVTNINIFTLLVGVIKY